MYGFVSTLRKILRDCQPDYAAACFDVGKKTFRQERYGDYKLHRPPMPDDLSSQIPLIKHVIAAYRIPVFELEGFEADDIIATIAGKVDKKRLKVMIVSGDKDMIQLVDTNIKILHPGKDLVVDGAAVKTQYGFPPERIVDFIALSGDKTDNIPGVNGIGDVTAKKLIKQYGRLEDVLNKIDEVTPIKLREKLRDQKEQALFSRELAALDRNVPIQFDLDQMKVREPDKKRLFALFQKLEFHKLLEAIEDDRPAIEEGKSVAVADASGIDDFVESARKNKVFAFWLDHADDKEALFEDIWLATLPKGVWRLNMSEKEPLREVFSDKDILKVCHGAKEAMNYFEQHGLPMSRELFDVGIAGYLISPSQGRYDIDTLTWTFLKRRMPSGGGTRQVRSLIELYGVLRKELEARALWQLFEDIEMPLARVLCRIESEGVRIDRKLLKTLSGECQTKIGKLEKELYRLSGGEFNLNSPKQLSRVLFDKLKLPALKKTKTGFSTDEGVLLKLSEKHKVPKLILEYRQLAKLKSTYIDALPRLADPETDRIHTTFLQTGTETGRLSSKNPNLQNIPVRTELGRQIRRAFIASTRRHLILSADYSQIELRILAHLSDDPDMKRAFKRDEDIHAYTASLIFDVKEGDVTAQMRNTAKRVNFGIIYGMSAFGLAKDLNISTVEAQAFIDKYFLRYPRVKKFMDEQIRQAEQSGYVLTLLNRRRYIPEIHNTNMAVRQFAQRQAINTPVQGSAADLIKLAMIDIQGELESRGLQTRMIITVHDELVFDVPEEERTAVIALVRHHMETPLPLSVPVKVSIKAGDNWLEIETV